MAIDLNDLKDVIKAAFRLEVDNYTDMYSEKLTVRLVFNETDETVISDFCYLPIQEPVP